jgi:D-xylose transport system permease protein
MTTVTPKDSVAAQSDGAVAVVGVAPEDSALPVEHDTLGAYFLDRLRQIRGGDAGVLPVVAGFILLVIIFQIQDDSFLSAGNLTNLIDQGSTFILLGMAEVFVLLLGEIDLSIGFVAGIGATVTCELAAPPHNVSWWLASLAGLAVSALLGFVQGTLITRLGLPSFVVTLGGLLGFEGLLLFLFDADSNSSGGTITVSNNVISDIVDGNLSTVAGWIVMIAIVAGASVLILRRDLERRGSGIRTAPLSFTALKIALITVCGVGLVLICNAQRGIKASPVRGMPWVVLVVLAILAGWTFLLSRTRFGRYIYAIGGNAEAARRAGINVQRVRTGAFTLSGLTAGAAGIVYASRLGSIATDIDGGTLVLYAVAAAVIGGTSLFGGRGKMVHALLGGLVIAAIYNGMGLLGLGSAAQYMVTALVLIAAVTIDALARRGRTVR